ncbi:MAG: family 10 glycosylhydrolase [Ferruginibacter sp.]
MKGIWIATFYNIDWPQRKQSVEQQKSSFIKMLDTLKSTGFNTIYFQIRSQCDAMYPSDIDPWSADLTGTQGLAPSPMWDPLQFAIDESRKRNMELHAWINPYRAIANAASTQNISPNHVSKKHPEWLLKSGNLRTLNPALQEVRNYITEVISDIITRYDVDGIHFDDYFYPEGDYNDDESYRLSKGNFTNKPDWRRNNVDLLIKQVSEKINEKKPWIKFGVSPTGIYQNSNDFAIGSATKGKQHYSELFSDTKKWLKEGWIDYLEPQLYWYFSQPGSAFDVLTKWWNSNAFDRDMYIGLGAYKVGLNQGWYNPSELSNQIRYALSPEMPNIKGVSVFSAISVLNNRLGLKDSLKVLFQTPSLIPTMPWKDNVAPAKLNNVSVFKVDDGYKLKWNADNAKNEMDVTKLYVIYSSTTLPLIQNSENVLAIISGENFYIDKRKINANHYYMITAVDRLQNESEPSEIVSTSGKPVEDFKPITQTIPGNDNITIAIKLYASPKLNNALTFRWEDKDFSSANEYFLEKSLNNKDFVLVAKFKPKAEVMFYDVYQLLESCYFRLKRIGTNGKTIYTNVISYHVQEPPITKEVEEDSKIVKNEVSGNFGEEDAKDLANNLKSGKSDTSLNIITEETIGIKTETPGKINTTKPENINKQNSISQPKNIYPPASPNLNKLGTVAPKYLANNSISVLINTVGLIEYILFKKSGEKLTWGKIQSNSSRSKVIIPGTNNLEAGEYRLELKKLTEKETSIFVIQ